MSLLINQAQKWAFIHIPKTGGTSITNVLSKIPGTKILQSHDSIRAFEDVDDFFIFTFVRNPYTRLASVYEHGIRKGIYKSTFSDLLTKESKSDIWLMPQYFFTKAGSNKQKKISFIGKYENLKEDIKHIFNTIGVNNYKLPHLNRNPIYDRHPNLKQEGYYKTFYSEDWMIDWVKERYKNDFKIFNYGMELPR